MSLSASWLISILFFAVSTCFSPGPNNLMLLTSGAKLGFQGAGGTYGESGLVFP